MLRVILRIRSPCVFARLTNWLDTGLATLMDFGRKDLEFQPSTQSQHIPTAPYRSSRITLCMFHDHFLFAGMASEQDGWQ